MVEESTAASHKLRADADVLDNSISRFDVGGGTSTQSAASAPERRTARSAPVLKTVGSAAVKAQPADDWEEF